MIETDDGIRITVSHHAARAGLNRLTDLKGRRYQDAIYFLELAALDAVRGGRRARRCPGWCVRVWSNGHSRRARLRAEGNDRFAWDEPQSFVMLLTGVPKEPEIRSHWHVVTVMTPDAVRPPD